MNRYRSIVRVGGTVSRMRDLSLITISKRYSTCKLWRGETSALEPHFCEIKFRAWSHLKKSLSGNFVCEWSAHAQYLPAAEIVSFIFFLAHELHPNYHLLGRQKNLRWKQSAVTGNPDSRRARCNTIRRQITSEEIEAFEEEIAT